MVLDWFRALPEWLVAGILLGLAASVLVAATFAVGARLFPTAYRPRAGNDAGESRRRREIRAYLNAIGEPYVEDHVVRGEPVAFYLPRRDVAITFDARAYFRIERSPTVAVLVEHEMPGAHLGARLPFETPTLTSEASDPTKAAFAVLGVPVGADHDEIKAAYRERIKEAHPDHGGDRETFKRIREAYTMAKEHPEK